MLVELCNKIIEISEDNDLTWEDKYGLIFRTQYTDIFYDMLTEINIKFEYDDPDADYEEDVEAFIYALKENLNRFTSIMKYVKFSDELLEKTNKIL